MKRSRMPGVACAVALILFGCGDDGATDREETDLSAEDAGAVDDGNSKGDCTLESVIAEHLEGVEGAVDCTAEAAKAEFRENALRKCVLFAQHEGQPFFAISKRQGFDSVVADGYVWDGKGPILELRYDSDPSGGSGVGSLVYQNSCAEIVESQSCPLDPAPPCLACDGSGPNTQVCTGAASE